MKSLGFSLLELLIYIAVIAIVMLIISGTFLAINKGQGSVESKSEVTNSLRFALDKINSDIRAATAVYTPTTSSTSTTLVMDVSGASTTYDVSGGQLRRQIGVGTPEPITPTTVTVSSPTFTRLENTNTYLSKTIISIRTSLTVSYNASTPEYQYSETKTGAASLRQ